MLAVDEQLVRSAHGHGIKRPYSSSDVANLTNRSPPVVNNRPAQRLRALLASNRDAKSCSMAIGTADSTTLAAITQAGAGECMT